MVIPVKALTTLLTITSITHVEPSSERSLRMSLPVEYVLVREGALMFEDLQVQEAILMP